MTRRGPRRPAPGKQAVPAPTGLPAASRIWDACREHVQLCRIRGVLYRIVESQEQVATSAIVDTAAEQAMLEDILEASKPPRRPGTAHLDYLLATAFRYPPLRHGSRFGTRFEPSIFYGSRAERTVLAEGAYYRFWFWLGMVRPPPAQQAITQHTIIRARYDTSRGLRLQHPPFDAHAALLQSPDDYAATQALGAALRAAGVTAFEYRSARDPGGMNVAAFSPSVFPAHGRIADRSEWTCMTTPQRVSFVNPVTRAMHEFRLEQFLVAGRFPDPAR